MSSYALGPLAVSAVFLVAGSHDLAATGFLAIPAVLTAGVVFSVLARQRRSAPAAAAPKAATGHDDWHGFLRLSAVIIFRSVAYFGIVSLVALYVGTGLHAGKLMGELALTVFLAGGAAGTVTGGHLADRYGRIPVTRLSFAAAAAGLAAVVLVPSPWVFLPIVFTGFSLFQSFSLTVTLGQDYLPSRIGTSSGVTLGLAISVGGLLTPVLGALADATSLRWALVVLVALLPVAFGLALSLRDPRPGLKLMATPASTPGSDRQAGADAAVGRSPRARAAGVRPADRRAGSGGPENTRPSPPASRLSPFAPSAKRRPVVDRLGAHKDKHKER